jgi:hypothetical protein
MAVLMKPGQIAVTTTPWDAQSARRHRESCRTAAFVAAYADSPAVGTKANPDDTFTT